MRIIPDTVFKLDNDFDLLIDDTNVHILRPSGFEFAGRLQQALLDAVPGNIEEIQRDLPFVDFADVKAYASNMKEVRSPDSHAYGILNDSDQIVSQSVLDAMRSYDVLPVRWSACEKVREELGA